MEDSKVLFVFYTINEKTEKNTFWSYKKLPKKWNWIGSGKTSAIKDKKLEYLQEEQFNGDKKTQLIMVEYLTKFFDKLKKDGIITKYKIRRSYLP
jgi:hypothetical protein